MSKLDELFGRKLADHSITPSANAWKNIETRLSKKNSRVIFMRWAAVFLFAGFLFSLLWIKSSEPGLPLAGETPASQPQGKEALKPEINPQISKVEKRATLEYNQEKKKTRPFNNPVQPALLVSKTSSLAEDSMKISGEEPERKELNTPEAMKTEIVSKSIVLTFTLEPVELPQIESAEVKVAASAERKDKSFKRMMKIANEVKNSDSPMGGIRNMKEDLFALDLKSKTTNKKH